MPSIRIPESVAALTKISSTTVSLAASRVNIGGQQYKSTAALTVSLATSGAGGIDTTLVANSLYYVYAVVSNGAMALIASTNSTLPSGFTVARLVGNFTTDNSSNVLRALSSGQLSYEAAALSSSDLRNLLIGGGFDLWQRGTSFPGAANGIYNADRFQNSNNTTAAITIARSTDVPTQAQSGFQSLYSHMTTVTTATGSIAASSIHRISHCIEGQNYQIIHGKKARIQFWVKATGTGVTGNYTLFLNNQTRSRAFATTFTVTTSGAWQKVILDLPMDNQSSGWFFDNTQGLNVEIVLAAGTNYTASTLNQWTTQAGFTGVAAASQVNFDNTVGNTFQLAQYAIYGVDANGVDLPFLRSGSDIQGELAKCQRYYEKSYAVDVALGTTGQTQGVDSPVWNIGNNTGSQTCFFRTTKRLAPSVVFWNNATGASGSWTGQSSAGAVTNVLAMTLSSASVNGFMGYAGGVVFSRIWGEWTADSEL